jgi:hypothetical protein
MQEDYIEQANVVDGAFNGQPQHKYDPLSNMYNLGWKDHLNLRYGNLPQQGNKTDSSTAMDFNPSKIIKRDSPLDLQIPMLWGHRVMNFVRR